MLKKFFIVLLLSIFILINSYAIISYAEPVKVTKENLSEALEKIFASEDNEENYEVEVLDDKINISVDGENYSFNYDLTDKPTFSYEIPIEKGMTYAEYKKQTNNIILPAVGYIAVANIYGVEADDASGYFLGSYLGSALANAGDLKAKYIIVDDLNVSEGVTIEKTDDPNTIYTSEFGDRVIELVDYMYKDTQTLSDTEGINSYTFSIDKTDKTETSCKLISKLIVNTEADFSKIKGYSDKLSETPLKEDITKENADCVLTLVEGQKCNIESDDKISNITLFGDNCIEINDNYTEMTATKVGKKNGYIVIGDVKKTIYIEVSEKEENKIYGAATLKITATTYYEEKTEVIEDQKENVKQEQTNDKVANIETLPKTGTEKNVLIIALYLIIGICTFGLITMLYIAKKKK